MRKHVTCALITFSKFLSRKIIELHFNLNTTVSINTVVNLFIHCTISIVQYRISLNRSRTLINSRPRIGHLVMLLLNLLT